MSSLKGSYKFRISSPEQSERLQNVLSSLGCRWVGGEPIGTHADKPHIYVSKYREISFGESNSFFRSHEYCEQDTEAFIAEHAPNTASNEQAAEQSEQSPIASNPWRLNTGVMPVCLAAVAGDVRVDVELRSGYLYNDGLLAKDYFWDLSGCDGDIIKWRFHNAVDAHDYAAVEPPKEKTITVKELGERIKAHIASQPNASTILQKARECLDNRATERDHEANGERSMKRCVESFNALTGHNLSITEGWIFMGILKLSRAQGGKYREDDYVDAAAYMALAGEEGATPK